MLVGKQFPEHSVKTKSIARNQLPSLHYPKSRRSEDLGAVWQTVVCKILDFKTCFGPNHVL